MRKAATVLDDQAETMPLATLPIHAPAPAQMPEPALAPAPAQLLPPTGAAPTEPDPAPGALPPGPPLHLMVTRSRAGIFKTRYPLDLASTALLSALVATTEPRGFKSAAKRPEWLAAMQDEIDALRLNQKWDLVLVQTWLVRNRFSVRSFMLMAP